MLQLVLRLRRMDWWLMGAILLLLVIGVMMLYGIETPTAGSLTKFDKQIMLSLIGLGLCFGVASINYRIWQQYAYIVYAVGFILLVLVLIFGAKVNGTKGWFEFGGFGLQPVEFIKILLMLTLARYCLEHAFSFSSWKTIVYATCLVVVYAALVLLQPDLGSAVVFIGSFFILLCTTKIRWQQIAVIVASLFSVILVVWFTPHLLKPYQRDRIKEFVNPTANASSSGYNVIQSIISVGSGQWFGRGLGFGTQSQLHFLPERDTDFIFAVVAEELGFVGAGAVIILIGIILWRLWLLMRYSNDSFMTYFLTGLCAIIFIHTMVNVGMNIGIMPVTGIPLPFVSAGGSSLLALLFAVGIVQNCYIQQKR